MKIVVWIKACFFILNQHWNNIDYLRINKFLYMVRLLLTEIFVYIKNQSWNKKVILSIILDIKKVDVYNVGISI